MVSVTKTEAQENFDQLLDQARREPVSITQDGKSSFFLISAQEMENLQSMPRHPSEAAQALEAWAERARAYRNPDAEELSDEEIVRLVHELR